VVVALIVIIRVDCGLVEALIN